MFSLFRMSTRQNVMNRFTVKVKLGSCPHVHLYTVCTLSTLFINPDILVCRIGKNFSPKLKTYVQMYIKHNVNKSRYFRRIGKNFSPKLKTLRKELCKLWFWVKATFNILSTERLWNQDTVSWNVYWRQGCQMVHFQTQNPNLGKIWRAMEWKLLLYFMTI
jgi:hypothetical protein